MVKKINQIFTLNCIVLLLVSITGCGKGSDTMKTETYSLTEVEKIEVKTNANDVIFRTTESEDLTITFKGGGVELASLENSVLVIDLHRTFAGITTKNLEPLFVDIPKAGLLAASIESDAGNITIENVNF